MTQPAGAIPVSRPPVWGDEADALREAIENRWLSGTSEAVDLFEAEFAARHGSPYAIAVSSGTTALHLALVALGVGSGDEVIVPDFTMISPVLAVMYVGAEPVAVDADDTWNLDVAAVKERITERTRAIVAVHTYGLPADVVALAEIARSHGVALVEDAAEALGACVDGRLAGTFGDVACFSFYANKLLTTGEGGMLLTPHESVAAAARDKRNLCFGAERRFEHSDVGFNYRLSGLQAALGRAQLRHLDETVAAKRAVAAAYDERLRPIRGCTLPPRAAGREHVFWVYGILVGDGAARDDLAAALAQRRIETRPFFTPLHAQPVLRDLLMPAAAFPRATALGERGLYLPSFVGMRSEEIDRVCDAVTAALRC